MTNFASALTSLLMSLPLVAVPCLAVFGLPSIGPATAVADADETLELAAHDDLGPASATVGGQAASDQAFAPIVDAGTHAATGGAPFSLPSADRSQIDQTSDHRGAAANRAVGLREAGSRAPADQPAETNGADVFTEAAQSPAATQSSAWESAVTRLNALGIRDFHLTNGELPGEFYFTCSIRSARNVTQRFEAEARSPAAAAEDVLAQVETWQAIR